MKAEKADEEKQIVTQRSQHVERKRGGMSYVFSCWLTGIRTVSELPLTEMILAPVSVLPKTSGRPERRLST